MGQLKPGSRHAAALLAIAAIGLSGCSAESAEPASTPSSASAAASSWMETIYRDHANVALGSVLIPGTHDSGSYAIDIVEPCANALIAGTESPIKALLKVEPCMLAGFSRAQDVDLKIQLESGIRYLDMRIGVPSDQVVTSNGKPVPPPAKPLDVPLVTHHSVVSASLRESLTSVLTFAREHPKEQVILDFQHVDLPKDPNVAGYYRAALKAYLRDFVPAEVPGATPVCARAWTRSAIPTSDAELSREVTFADAWAANRNLIVLMDPGGLAPDDCFRNRNEAILSQWPYTQDEQLSVKYNQIELEQRQQRMAANPPKCKGTQSIGMEDDGTPKPGTQPANWCGFFVSQLQMSLSNSMYAGCVLDPRADCSLFAFAQDVNPDIGKEMVGWAEGGLPANISIADFFEHGSPSIVDTMIDHNRKRAERG